MITVVVIIVAVVMMKSNDHIRAHSEIVRKGFKIGIIENEMPEANASGVVLSLTRMTLCIG